MPTTLVATAYGGPEVLELRDLPAGEPGPGEVLLEVRAAGVNPIDWKSYSGMMGADPSALPLRLGYEGAGVVVAAGPGASFAEGDEVVGYPAMGACAELLVVPAGSLVPKPAGLGWEDAGGLMVVGVTAVHALAAVRAGDGETVLIHGASGGVGAIAVQLAVARGARVIATASEARHTRLRELGAEPVVYGDGLEQRVRALAPDGADAAIDCVGTDEAVDASLVLVSHRDRIATIAAFGRAGAAGIQLLGNGPGADPGTEIRNAARADVLQRAADGTLKLEVTARPLADAADVHREGLAGRIRGKVVLIP